MEQTYQTPHPIMLASRDLYAVARTQPATSYSAIPVIRYAANCLGSAHKGQNTQLKILFTFALLLPHAEMVCNEAMKARTVITDPSFFVNGLGPILPSDLNFGFQLCMSFIMCIMSDYSSMLVKLLFSFLQF